MGLAGRIFEHLFERIREEESAEVRCDVRRPPQTHASVVSRQGTHTDDDILLIHGRGLDGFQDAVNELV